MGGGFHATSLCSRLTLDFFLVGRTPGAPFFERTFCVSKPFLRMVCKGRKVRAKDRTQHRAEAEMREMRRQHFAMKRDGVGAKRRRGRGQNEKCRSISYRLLLLAALHFLEGRLAAVQLVLQLLQASVCARRDL